MKNLRSTLLVIVLSFSQISLVAQQQGFGYIKSKQLVSFSGIDNVGRTNVKPVVNMPPVFGEKARKKGASLSLPFGVGIYSLYYEQGYLASNLKLTTDSSAITARADTVYQNTTAYEFKAQIRPNLWVFPFLNIYGIFGYTQGEISPDLSVPYIVVENIPVIDSIIIDTTFEIHDNLKYIGPTFGIGATFSIGLKYLFFMADYNYSVTNPKDIEENLHNHFFSPKIGVFLGNKKRKSFGALWVGAMYISNDQSFSGKISVEDITPELVFLFGEEANYSGKIIAKSRWNMLAGVSWVIYSRHHIVLEGGFINRSQISFGYDFRF
jgi:hypothetical protein